MKIGIDCRLPYYQMGGISQYVLHLVRALAALDGEGRYLLFHSRKDSRDYRPEQPNFTRRNLWTPCHHRLERWALAAELWPYRLDVFHSPDFIPPAGAAGRHIITVHDLNFLHYPQYLTPASRRYYADQIRWATGRASHISADSHYTRQGLIDLLGVPAAKVTTIHLAANPIYQQEVPAGAIQQTLSHFNLPAGFLLFVGTLEPRKNVPTLLKAWANAGLDLPLVLVGRKGWLYDQIFQTAGDLKVANRLRHLEVVSNEQLACLYRAAGVLLLPSYDEGFGLPPLEAMHCDCPVIVSRRGSLPEVVGPAGLQLEPEDVPAWAEAMGRVLADSQLRAEMIRSGREQAAQFSWSKTAQATLALYHS